jgi:hypothetical protein
VIVVDYAAQLLLEWERLEVFPSEVLSFEDVDSVLELVKFL